jgi:phospholipid transport system transporter-binding protein
MLVLPDTLSSTNALDAWHMLEQALKQWLKNSSDPQVVVDASGLKHFDSAALAVLLACQRMTRAKNRTWAVYQPPERLSTLAHLYGVGSLLGFPSI